MKRREFIAGLGAAATWPLASHAQQAAGRVYRVGYLSLASRERSLHVPQGEPEVGDLLSSELDHESVFVLSVMP